MKGMIDLADCYVDKIIELALSEVGYKEKASNKDLEDETANAGHANFNKYANFIDSRYPTFYNGKKNGFDWCAVFVDYLFLKCYGYEDALRLTCQPEKSLGASCTMDSRYYKEAKRFGNSPRIGAQIFFSSDGNTCYHTGIVVDYTDTTVTTVEGNVSDSVQKKTYERTDNKIYGYGYPDYTADKKTFVVDVDSKKYKQIVINIK